MSDARWKELVRLRITVEMARYGLTRREREMLWLRLDGYAYKEIAYMKGISVATVRNHLTAANEKMGVTGSGQMAAMAKLIGWRE